MSNKPADNVYKQLFGSIPAGHVKDMFAIMGIQPSDSPEVLADVIDISCHPRFVLHTSSE